MPPKNLKTTSNSSNLQGACIAPGFIDTHIHGIEGHGTDDQSPDSILKMSESLTKYGVTSFIPTLYSAPRDKMIKDIKSITAAMGKEKGSQNSRHSSGGDRFISPGTSRRTDAGFAQPGRSEAHAGTLGRRGKENHQHDGSAGTQRHARTFPLLHRQRHRPAGGTHNATYEQMVEGMQVRILHVTHLFNAMSRMHHRDPNAVGAVFIHPKMSCEIIADGIHINPNLIKFLLRCKPIDKLVLVTDSLKPTKQTEHPLMANGEEVYLDKCFYRKSDDVIAGSALTMSDGVRNLVSFGISLDQAVQMASTNPANIMRQEHLGLIAPGYDADLVVLDQNLTPVYTIVKGEFFKEGKKLCAL